MFKAVLCLVMALAFTPAGVWTLRTAFSLTEGPHVFAMLLFSGCLMILLGLAGLGGLYFRWRPPGGPGEKAAPAAPEGEEER
ncbi:MAG: hypothetical protein LBW85_09855 [Deltaproteobacteria bacterium]|nr:hypothetical protein [Deltaproteobacteria bacterium]